MKVKGIKTREIIFMGTNGQLTKNMIEISSEISENEVKIK